MSKIRIVLYTAGSFWLAACGNGTGEPSAYGDLLSQSPYGSLTDSIRRDPQDPALYIRRGILLKNNRQTLPALADFQKAWALRPSEESGARISQILLEQSPDSAVQFIRQALTRLPGSLFLQLDLARAYAGLRRTDQAVTVCDSILARYPNQVDALMMKSDLLDSRKDTAGSVHALEKAYELAPFDVELNYELAFKLAQSKNPRTLSLCDSLIRMDSLGNHAEPYYFQGVYYANTGDQAKALDYFTQAISHDYNFLDAYLDKGALLYRMKRTAEALKVFQLAATISPAYADAYYWMGKCQEVLGQPDQAKANYLRAYGFDKTLVEARDAAARLK